jgi:hypothetical protein
MVTISQNDLKIRKNQILNSSNCQEDNQSINTNSSGSETLLPLHRTKSIVSVVKCLSRKALLRLKGNHTGEILINERGVLWITQTGNPNDLFLNDRESLVIIDKGDLLIQAMDSARLKISRQL